MALDFSGGGRQTEQREEEVSFEEVAKALLDRADEVCRKLLPGGKRYGREYVCASIDGGRGSSFSVNLDKGVWRDFAAGHGGADLINLWSTKYRQRPIDAKREAAEWLGIDILRDADRHVVPPSYTRQQANTTTDGDNWWRGQKPSRAWDYYDSAGALFAQVLRWDHPATGEKVVRPWDPERQLYHIPDGPRPLFNLQGVARSDSIVYVEGEKCAEILIQDGWVATTNMGGSQAVGHTDWSPVAGKDVVIWRDNDRAGSLNEAAVCEEMRKCGAASVRCVVPPADKPAKWDCADATAEERLRLIEEAKRSRPVFLGRRVVKVSDHTADSVRYYGAAAEREYLVAETISLAAPTLLAAMGGVGKSMLLLDLAFKVSCCDPNPLGPTAFGHTVTSFGRSVIMFGEDDRDEIHRRLNAIDPDQRRRRRGGLLHVIPMPSVGGSFSIVQTDKGVFRESDAWKAFCDQITAYDDLKFIGVDPLASFVHGNLDQDTALGQFIGSTMSALAAETGAAVVTAHHMRKGKALAPIITADDARQNIRGTSSLVDSHRTTIALWVPPSSITDKEAETAKVSNDPGNIVYGAVVKTNMRSDMGVKKYIRNQETGLLEDRTSVFNTVNRQELDSGKSQEQTLIDAIAEAAEKCIPFQKTGKHGVGTARHHELPEGMPGRQSVQAMVDRLLREGKIRVCQAGRGHGWLDVPGGRFDRGLAEFRNGSFVATDCEKND